MTSTFVINVHEDSIIPLWGLLPWATLFPPPQSCSRLFGSWGFRLNKLLALYGIILLCFRGYFRIYWVLAAHSKETNNYGFSYRLSSLTLKHFAYTSLQPDDVFMSVGAPFRRKKFNREKIKRLSWTFLLKWTYTLFVIYIVEDFPVTE